MRRPKSEGGHFSFFTFLSMPSKGVLYHYLNIARTQAYNAQTLIKIGNIFYVWIFNVRCIFLESVFSFKVLILHFILLL